MASRAATVDGGATPVARCRDSVALARRQLLEGQGAPPFIEFETVRLWGHYNKDPQHYRPKDEWDAAQARDPIALLRQRIIAADASLAGEIETIDNDLKLEFEALKDEGRSGPLSRSRHRP